MLSLLILLLLEPIDGFADFHCSQFLLLLVSLWCDDSVSSLAGYSSGEVGLVLLALGVGEVTALVGVEGEA